MNKLIGKVLGTIGMKKAGLRVYFFVFNSWKDGVIRWRKATIPGIVRRRSARGVCAIDLDSDWLGLGARIIKTLEILLYCEEHGLIPVVRYSYREKGDEKTDYFGELFFYKQPFDAIPKTRFTRIREVAELGTTDDFYNRKLSLSIAKPLFDKYLGFQPAILEEVDAFAREHFGGRRVLGVHYRGTDKAGEAFLVSKERLLDAILERLSEREGFDILFISTDDQQIIDFLNHADLPVPLVFRKDAIRSRDGDQIHRRKDSAKTIVHRDAIVNMLILSRCNFLLKTASILSDCSVVFNPDLPLKVISFPKVEELTWWPATEIRLGQGVPVHPVAPSSR